MFNYIKKMMKKHIMWSRILMNNNIQKNDKYNNKVWYKNNVIKISYKNKL